MVNSYATEHRQIYTGGALEVFEYMEIEKETGLSEHMEIEGYEHIDEQDSNEFEDDKAEEYEYDHADDNVDKADDDDDFGRNEQDTFLRAGRSMEIGIEHDTPIEAKVEHEDMSELKDEASDVKGDISKETGG